MQDRSREHCVRVEHEKPVARLTKQDFELHKAPAVITGGNICNRDAPVASQFVRQPALQATAYEEPNRNLGVKIADACDTCPGVSGIIR